MDFESKFKGKEESDTYILTQKFMQMVLFEKKKQLIKYIYLTKFNARLEFFTLKNFLVKVQWCQNQAMSLPYKGLQNYRSIGVVDRNAKILK